MQRQCDISLSKKENNLSLDNKESLIYLWFSGDFICNILCNTWIVISCQIHDIILALVYTQTLCCASILKESVREKIAAWTWTRIKSSYDSTLSLQLFSLLSFNCNGNNIIIRVFKLHNDNNRSSVCSVICNSWIKCCCISESSKLEEVGEKPTHIISIINDLSDRWHSFYSRGGLGVLDSDLISDKLFVLPAHGVVYMAGSARLIPICLQQFRTADVFIFLVIFATDTTYSCSDSLHWLRPIVGAVHN